jgi:hypothetical protein
LVSRLSTIGISGVREYQRCIENTLKMLQVEPEERKEVDTALKRISREVNRRVNKFLDLLDMTDR